MKKIFTIIVCVLLLALTHVSLNSCKSSDLNDTSDLPENDNNEQLLTSPEDNKYEEALELLEIGEYEKAYALLTSLGKYKDSEEYLSKFYYVPTSGDHKADGGTASVEVTMGSDSLPAKKVLNYFGEIFVYDYTYDTDGNLIKKIYTSSNGGWLFLDECI